jgi:hypothetical protein
MNINFKEFLKEFITQFKIIFFLSLFISLILIDFSFGAIVECKVENGPCTWEDLVSTMRNLVSQIVIISFWIAMLMATVGAFLIMLHGPYEAMYSRGVSLIRIAIWGYILVLFSGIIFDFIIDFFQPKFALAVDSTALVTSWYETLKNSVMASLKCGQPNQRPLERLRECIFKAIDLLKNIAVVFLALAIIVSAMYIISVPLFGFKNIPMAYQTLIWSIIGLVIILLASLIERQIEIIIRR